MNQGLPASFYLPGLGWASPPPTINPSMKRLLALVLALAAISTASAQDWAKARLDKSPATLSGSP
jgi:hypothetical protein